MTEKQAPYFASRPHRQALGHFDYAVKKLLSLEGGEVNDSYDPGGHTNFGISARAFPEEDIENMTEARAIALYREYFWEPNRYGEISDRELAGEMLELSAVCGAKTANRLLQRAVNRTDCAGGVVLIDGICGEKTIAAVNAHPQPAYLLCMLKLVECGHFAEIGNPRFLLGWIRRAIL